MSRRVNIIGGVALLSIITGLPAFAQDVPAPYKEVLSFLGPLSVSRYPSGSAIVRASPQRDVEKISSSDLSLGRPNGAGSRASNEGAGGA